MGDFRGRAVRPLRPAEGLGFDVKDERAGGVFRAGHEAERVPLQPGDARDVDEEETEGVEGVVRMLGDLDLQRNGGGSERCLEKPIPSRSKKDMQCYRFSAFTSGGQDLDGFRSYAEIDKESVQQRVRN